MHSKKPTRFAVREVAIGVAAAFAAAQGLAAPTPNQMPGAGTIIATSLGSAGTSQGGVGTSLVNLVSGGGIGIDGKAVIRWGGSGAPVDAINPQGFNLGANATFYYGAISANSAVLNIDASGNPSQIFGTLVSTAGSIAAVGPLAGCGACTSAPALFLSNANGIVVGAGGRIVAPAGVGLIGADMDNPVSIADFVANNTWVNPGPPVLGTSYLTFGPLPTAGATPGQVDIAGAINGDLTANLPAEYVLVAGNNVNVLNTGNLFGKSVVISAGVIATASAATVNGVTNTTVNRLFNVDTDLEAACCRVGTAAYELTISGPAGSGNIVNEGSISAAGVAPIEIIALQAAGNIRSGIDGSTDTLVGLFSDQGIVIDSYSNDSTVELYNVIAGYTTNKTLPDLRVNGFASNEYFPSITAQSFRPDVIVKAITPGLQPSSITTLEEVEIYGGNVTIASTINHKLAADGSPNGDWDLVLDATKALTVSADVGAGRSVYLTAGTDMTISGNVIADTDGSKLGGIYGTGGTSLTRVSGDLSAYDDIRFNVYNDTEFSGMSTTTSGDFELYNHGQGATNKTTVSGDVFSGGGVYITQYQSPLNAPILISGNIVATGGDVDILNGGASLGNTTTVTGDVTSVNGDVLITNVGLLTGMLETSGVITADGLAALTSDGDAKIGEVNAANILTTVGGLNLEVNGPWTADSSASIISPLATAKFLPDAVVTAPAVTLAGLTYRGVDASGAAYASEADKPDAQFVTNIFTVALSGNINAPIAGNTNWPLNSMDIAPLVTLAPVLVSVSANGGGFQAVNLRVLGNSVFDTGATTTPFIGVPLTTGGFPAGGLQGNLGSQLIMQADGSLTIIGTPTFSLTGPPIAAQWPGGAAFIAGTTLQLLTPFYNAWSTASPPFGGSFFTAPAISLNGYIATSGTAWANFSTKPLTGDPTVYQIRQLGTNSFGFAATTEFVMNDYMNTVAGGPVCNVTGPTTWASCP